MTASPPRRTLAHLALVAAAAVLPYARTLDVPFILDDQHCIVRNPALRALDPAESVQEDKSICAPPTRAFGELTLALNYRLNGLEVAGYHVFNIAVHLAAALLVYALVRLLFAARDRVPADPQPGAAPPGPAPPSPSPESPGGDPDARAGGTSAAALVAALLFAVHPIQTQAITYVVQRFASLATALYLLAVVLYLASRLSAPGARRWVAYAGALVASVLAMYTKEIAFTLPLVLALLEALVLRGPRRTRAAMVAPFLLTLFVIPVTLLGVRTLTSGTGVVDASLRGMVSDGTMTRWQYVLTQPGVIVQYLRLLVLPYGQNLDHDVPLHRSVDASVIGAVATLSVLLALGVLALVRSARRDDPASAALRVAGVGVLWFFVTLSVESSVVPLPDLLVEHRMYLPSVGLFMSLAAAGQLGLARLARWRPRAAELVPPVLAVAVLGLAALTFRRNEIWRDAVALWEDVAAKSPAKERVHLELGRLYMEAGRLDDAVRALSTASRLAPEDPAPYSTLGAVLRRQRRPEEALASYAKALQLDPSRFDVHYNLALLLASEGRLPEAVAEFQEAARLRPQSAEVRNALGVTFARAGRLDDAIAEFEAALRLDPRSASARRNLERARTAR